MAGIITYGLKNRLVQQFISDITSPNNSYYVTFGRSSAWPDEYAPPTPNTSVSSSLYEVYDKMLFGKKLSSGDVAYIAKKNLWTIDTVYDYYSHLDGNLFDKNFVVVNRFGRVYKCLFNNYGAASTVEPNETVVKTHFITSDGYIWKYLYTINSLNDRKFSTATHMPVISDETVSLNAEDGAIHVIILEDGGQDYISAEGYVEAVLTSSTSSSMAKISNTGSSIISGAYNLSTFYISSGSGQGDMGVITDYTVNSSGKFVTTDFDLQDLDTSSYYNIAPTVTIVGSGSGAKAVAVVNTNSGSISNINVVARGTNYIDGKVTISSNVEFGSGASAYPIISPYGGHGYNVVEELGVDTIGISLDTFASDNFPEWVSYRQTGLIVNPIATTNNEIYKDGTFTQVSSYGIINVSDPLPPDEIITGYNSGATATVVYMTTTDLFVVDPTGNFQIGETVTGFYTGITCTISGINNRDLVPYSGSVLHVNNFEPVSRDGAPSEKVKIYFKV